MTKTQMPEPFAYAHPHVEKGPLFTTAHMESYANARVKQALEEAAMILKANAEVCNIDTEIILRTNAEAIRDLIPKGLPCET